MAARGTLAKQTIKDKLAEVFSGKFYVSADGKEIRISCEENGEEVQIKIAMTCAKDNIDMGTSSFINFETATNNDNSSNEKVTEVTKPSEEEKERVKTLCQQLGLLK